jgi:hypothetical protein
MLANKNNHLIKQILRKSGGKTVAPTVEQNKAEVETKSADPDLSEADEADEAGEAEVDKPDEPMQLEYPDTKYLYRNIQNLNYPSTKTYVCAFHLADNFVKYIVETKDTKVEFPSFEFENIQKGGFLDDDIASGDLDMSFQNNVIEFVQTFFVDASVPSLQEEKEVLSSPQSPSEEILTPSQSPDEEVLSSPQSLNQEVSSPSQSLDEELLSSPQSLNQEVSSPSQSLDEELLSSPQSLNQEVSSPSQSPSEEILTPSQSQEVLTPSQSASEKVLSSSESLNTEKPLVKGGYLEQATREEPSEEEATNEEPSEEEATNKEQSQEEVTNEEPSQEEASDVFAIAENPEYIGFVKGKEASIYVFVKIPSEHNLKPEYNNSILNELFHTFKVFDKDVDDSIRTLFENNTWLLDDKEPYSGYLCKYTEDGQLANVKEEDGDEIGELINIDSIGDYYYFSFLPIDMENAKEYKRFAIFPNEYVCIHNETQMAEYKENKSAYAHDKSVYFKDTEGREFFAVKTPSQFVKE